MAVAPGGFGVEIVGLPKLRSDLRTADRQLRNVPRDVHRQIAREGRDRARQIAMGLPGRQLFARIIGGRGSDRAATIYADIGKHPAGGGWLFGSHQYRQFRPWVGNQHISLGINDSYAITPAIRELEEQWAKTYASRISETLDRTLGT